MADLSDEEKEIGNALARYLWSAKRYVTKTEMLAYLGWKQTESNDRKLRYILAEIGKRKPLLSPSNGKGYKIAQTIYDLREAEHQYNENASRIKAIEERQNPLHKFITDFGETA